MKNHYWKTLETLSALEGELVDGLEGSRDSIVAAFDIIREAVELLNEKEEGTGDE